MQCPRLFVLCLILFLISEGLPQTEIELRPSKDNTLYEDSAGSLSNGAGRFFFVGRTNQNAGEALRRGLLAFPVADSIPAGATITEVTLTLHMSRTISGAQEITLHRVTADWGEAGSDAPGEEGPGTTAESGDATWLHRFHDSEFWSKPGGDYSDTVSGKQTVSGVGFYTWESTDEMVADVQSWLNEPGENFGWILIGNELNSGTTKRFATRENTLENRRPVLTVTYSTTTAVAGDPVQPEGFRLLPNRPNPFNPSTVIAYALPPGAETFVSRLEIFNLLGIRVRTLVEGRQPAGTYSVIWDGTDASGRRLPAGVYVYRLTAGPYSKSRTMILLP